MSTTIYPATPAIRVPGFGSIPPEIIHPRLPTLHNELWENVIAYVHADGNSAIYSLREAEEAHRAISLVSTEWTHFSRRIYFEDVIIETWREVVNLVNLLHHRLTTLTRHVRHLQIGSFSEAVWSLDIRSYIDHHFDIRILGYLMPNLISLRMQPLMVPDTAMHLLLRRSERMIQQRPQLAQVTLLTLRPDYFLDLAEMFEFLGRFPIVSRLGVYGVSTQLLKLIPTLLPRTILSLRLHADVHSTGVWAVELLPQHSEGSVTPPSPSLPPLELQELVFWNLEEAIMLDAINFMVTAGGPNTLVDLAYPSKENAAANAATLPYELGEEVEEKLINKFIKLGIPDPSEDENDITADTDHEGKKLPYPNLRIQIRDEHRDKIWGRGRERQEMWDTDEEKDPGLQVVQPVQGF